MTPTVFLLSPAHCGGKRADLLLRASPGFELARRVQETGAPLGEVFSFVSGLYFRGKMAYAGAFARPPEGVPGALVITSGRGLLAPTTSVDAADLRAFREVAVDLRDRRYREPLEADVDRLAATLPEDARVVLLGSIATSKYLEALLDRLDGRLCYPEPFLGMGDMQRGALMLRAARAGVELPYVTASAAAAGRPRRRAR